VQQYKNAVFEFIALIHHFM